MGYHDYILGEEMDKEYEELFEKERGENIKLREEIIERSEELVETLTEMLKVREEKTDVEKRLLQRNEEALGYLDDVQFLLSAIQRIVSSDKSLAHLIAKTAVKDLKERITKRKY